MARRGLKICCFTSAVFLAILTIIIVTLSLTIFKPKQPQITAHPIGLKNIRFNVTTTNVTLDVTLSMLVTIDNPNYGGFEYKSTTGYVNYHGSTVAEVPIEHNKIPARAKVNITTSTDLIADKLVLNPSLWEDVASGCLNFTSTATLHGKVSMAKIFNFHATAYSTCYILFHIQSQTVDSKCKSRIKL
ncbi:uncharacterized protein LOC115682306 [Syzygium oleosum]|uniref:uncharacterized protein LOC115682306 n=1 Tax=Syzygium oleosum TaxID=219896 RepID=UPI0011D23B6C|nr:uncharacterized protein LOC115682306 [Syzygium oleosum]